MPTYKKWLIGIACVVGLCVISYHVGYISGLSEGRKPAVTATQEESTPRPSHLISADLFIPNFNANANSFRLADYRPVQDDFIEFGNTSQNLIIIGKGDTAKLNNIGIIFQKNSMQAYDEAMEGIRAAILALSPSTTSQECRYIMEQLGLFEDINKAEGMKISEHHGIRYAITYETYRINFMAMPDPAN
jgi:hypothetical protein